MRKESKPASLQSQEARGETEEEFRPTLLGRIVDTFALGDGPGIPIDLIWEMKKVEGPYLDVLRGKISDPTEAEEIRKNYKTWYRKLYNYLHPTE